MLIDARKKTSGAIFNNMQVISTIAYAMGSAWVSGINLYACVATLGLLGRYADLQLPGELTVLTSWWVIDVSLVLYLIEFLADKIPVVDSIWDAVHTVIRVPAGAVLAAAAFGDFDRGSSWLHFCWEEGLRSARTEQKQQRGQ